ncbi:hypothetical protein MXB_308, partial [Myxobolus squamalis]
MKPKGMAQEIIHKRKQLLCIQKPNKEEPEDDSPILFRTPKLRVSSGFEQENSSLSEPTNLSTSCSQSYQGKIKKKTPPDDETNWDEVIKMTVGVNKKKFNRQNIEVIDMNDDDVMGDCSELLRDRGPKTVTHFK